MERLVPAAKMVARAGQHPAGVVVQFGCALHVLHSHVFEVTMCIGPSMLPTFNQSGDIVFLDRVSPRFRKLQVGEVVVVSSPTTPGQTVCKRIWGLVRSAPHTATSALQLRRKRFLKRERVCACGGGGHTRDKASSSVPDPGRSC